MFLYLGLLYYISHGATLGLHTCLYHCIPTAHLGFIKCLFLFIIGFYNNCYKFGTSSSGGLLEV